MKHTTTEEQELHIAQHIINAGTGRPANAEQVCEWFEKHPKARKLLTDAELLAGEIASINPEQKERDLARLRSRMHHYKRMRTIRRITISVAASVAVVLTCVWNLNHNTGDGIKPELAEINEPVVKEEVPTLLFASGEKRDMTDYAVNKKMIDMAQIGIPATEDPSSVLNVYKVPRMFTSHLALPDSTIVYLNADSELSFPSRFSDSVRTVTLRGEAYFQVRQDKVPFVVRVNDAEIKVYGTKFNVRAYTEEEVSAVLVEGKIGMVADGQEVCILPNQRIVHSAEIRLQVDEVDPADYIGWMEHRFKYNSAPLDQILSDIGRWYGVEFVVSPEWAGRTYSLCFDRASSLEWVVEAMEKIIGQKMLKEGGRYRIE